VDAEKIDLLNAVDYLGRTEGGIYLPINSEGKKDARVLFGLATHPDDGTIDDLLVRAPEAVKHLVNGNDPTTARDLLKSIDSRIDGITKKRNYGYKIEGHHPLAIGGSYLLTSDMSMNNAQKTNDILRLNGLNVGTNEEWMLPITRPGHDIAHLDPITHKTNKRAFQGETIRFRQPDPEARAMAYIPMGLLEQCLSFLSFNSNEEQTVRRFAGELINRDPALLYSIEKDPNYKTATGRQGNLSYAKSAFKLLKEPEMEQAVKAGYGNGNMSEIIEPNQFTFEYKSGKKPAELRDRSNSIGTPVKDELLRLRPGQEAQVLRLIR
jgi:hypothetical protein